MRRLAASLQFLSADCGESLWTMFHELCWLPVSSWAVEQSLLCMQLISCVAVWQRQQYPSSAVEIHDKLEGPSLGPLGGDTDNYTGAKFRINTSLIVRTSIRRIETILNASYLLPENMHFNTWNQFKLREVTARWWFMKVFMIKARNMYKEAYAVA